MNVHERVDLLLKILRHALVGLALAISLGACSAIFQEERTWKQGPAVALPHVVSKIDAIELRLVRQEPQLVLTMSCTGPGTYHDVKVSVTVNDVTFSSTMDQVECTGPNVPLADQLVLQTDRATRVASETTISLEASFVRGNLRGGKDSVLYMTGTDGQLRQGAGSVWR